MPERILAPAKPCRVTPKYAGSGAGVYWNVRSSATIGTDTAFVGNILALTSIWMNSAASDHCGRALADTGEVTLQMNRLNSICAGELPHSNGLSGGLDVTTTPGGGTEVVFRGMDKVKYRFASAL